MVQDAIVVAIYKRNVILSELKVIKRQPLYQKILASKIHTSQAKMASATSNVVDGVVRYPPTGLKVIIVGAGLAGLCMGIESWRKGHDVEIIERSNSIVQTGLAAFPP